MGYAATDRIFKIENANREKGTGTRVEINGGFTKKTAGPTPKVMLTFQSYNSNAEAGAKITADVKIYLDLYEADVLQRDIFSGKVAQMGVKEKKRAEAAGEKFCKAVWSSHLSGVSATSLANKGQARADGKSLSRVMHIVPANKEVDGFPTWVLQAQSGPGEEMANGLIKPAYSKPEQVVRVMLTSQNLKEMACAIDRLCAAYMLDRWNSWENGFRSNPIEHIDDDGVIIED